MRLSEWPPLKESGSAASTGLSRLEIAPHPIQVPGLDTAARICKRCLKESVDIVPFACKGLKRGQDGCAAWLELLSRILLFQLPLFVQL